MTVQLDMFEEEGAATAAPNLQQITKLGEEMVALERHVASLEDLIKEANARLSAIRNGTLPEAMATAGMAAFTLADGTKIEIKDFCSGSLPKDAERKDKAIAWLVANGGDSLVKHEISVPFGRNQHNEALALEYSLRQSGLPVESTVSVHPQTLQAFAREKLRNGDEIDLEALGLFAGRTARVKGGKS